MVPIQPSYAGLASHFVEKLLGKALFSSVPAAVGSA